MFVRSHRFAAPGSSLALLFALLALAPAAAADELYFEATITMQAVPWNQSVALPRFDPAVGFLRRVRVGIFGQVAGTAGVENIDSSPQTGYIQPTAYLTTILPIGSIGTANPTFEAFQWLPSLAPYDGVTDFAGPSGASTMFGPATGTGAPSQSGEFLLPPELAAYTGPAGNPGTVTITVDATDATLPPLPWLAHRLALECWARVHVLYTYDTFPGVYCHPYPAGNPCPCGNFGTGPHGCANSANSAGGLLSGQGSASVSNDTFVLTAQSMPDTVALFVQSESFTYTGFFHGDGLNCLAGPIVRMASKPIVSGAAQYPASGDAPISVQGQVPAPGAMRYYQVLYRDSASFCTSSNFNLTNGIHVPWQF